MAHQTATVTDFHEDDTLILNVVLTDSTDTPITTTTDWSAEFILRESETDDGTPVVEKDTVGGGITFEPLTSEDIADMDAVTSTDGDKAVVTIAGEGSDGTAGDTSGLLGTGTDREATATYYFWTRAWNANDERSTVNTGTLELIAW